MPKLFVSFRGTLKALLSGRVTIDHLATGLFLFGCTRNYAMTIPGTGQRHPEGIVNEFPELHKQLVKALTQAEAENRVRWRTKEGRVTFAMISELLIANDFEPLLPGESEYNYSEVANRCLDISVIY